MTNELTILDSIQLPAYLQQYVIPDTDEYDIVGGEPIGRLGVKGKVFSVHYRGEITPMLSDDGKFSVQYLDVAVVAGKPGDSRVYYAGAYEDGSFDPPDCSALDGKVPDSIVPDPQSATCATCQWSVGGTAADGKSQKCQTNKRFAILPRGDLVNEQFGGPVLMTVTPGSFKNFRPYKKRLQDKGLQLHMVYTRLSFDVATAHPKLIFEFAGLIPQEDMETIMAWREHEHTERVLFVNSAPAEDTPQIPRKDEREAEVTPTPSRPVVVASRAPEVPSSPTVAAAPPRKAKPGPARKDTPQAPPPVEALVSAQSDPDAALRALIDGGGLATILDGEISIPG